MNDEGQKTPKWLFDKIEAIVEQITGRKFALDAAASPWNAQCGNYFTRDQDSLKQDWTAYKNIFLNAPFAKDEIGPFVWKAIASKAGCTVALLVPVWTSYEWCVELKKIGQYHDIVGLVFFELFSGKRIVRNKGDKQIQVAIIGPDVKPGNGPAIYAPMPPKKESLDPAGTNGAPVGKPGTNGAFAAEPVQRVWAVTRRHGPRMVRGSKVQAKKTEWFWYPRIPLGELSMLEGDPGFNKSSIATDLTARVTTGMQMPDGTPGVEGGVVLCLAEDSWEKTVRPRLDVAGADLHRVMFVENFTIPRDEEVIAKAVGKTNAKLVVIDPLNAFLTADANSDQKVRQALIPIYQMAKELNVAVLMVRHLVKRGGRNALYLGLGSIGIIAAARSALLVRQYPDDEDLRVLCHSKTNLGPYAPSLLYEPVDRNGVVGIEWRGESDYKAEDLLGQTRESRLLEAITFLSALLASGPVPQGTVKAKAVSAGLAWRTVERAKEVLGVVAERKGWGVGSQSIWRTPPSAEFGGVWTPDRN